MYGHSSVQEMHGHEEMHKKGRTCAARKRTVETGLSLWAQPKEYESTTRQPNQQVYHASRRHAQKNQAVGQPSSKEKLQDMHGNGETRKKGKHVRHAKELWKQSSVCGLSQGIRKHHTATQPAGLPRKPKACPKEEEGGETTSGYGAVAHSRSVKGELG